jgi:hypothetical protein
MQSESHSAIALLLLLDNLGRKGVTNHSKNHCTPTQLNEEYEVLA